MSNIITLYHGTNMVIEQPELRPINRPMDFGVGFYTTTFQKQAEDWANKKAKRLSGTPVVNVYQIDLNKAKKDLQVKSFVGVSENWLDFILKCRKESAYDKYVIDGKQVAYRKHKDMHHTYDIVIGEVADDTVFDSIGLYIDGVLPKDALLKRLKAKKANDQYCFSTTEAIKYLEYDTHYILAGGLKNG